MYINEMFKKNLIPRHFETIINNPLNVCNIKLLRHVFDIDDGTVVM